MEHGESIGGQEALDILAELSQHIPPCSQCGGTACGPWIKYFLFWTLQTVTDPEGPIAMFLALVHRTNDETIIESEELENLRRDKVVLVKKLDDGQGHPKYKVSLLPRAEAITDFQKHMGDDDPDAIEWPDLIG